MQLHFILRLAKMKTQRAHPAAELTRTKYNFQRAWRRLGLSRGEDESTTHLKCIFVLLGKIDEGCELP